MATVLQQQLAGIAAKSTQQLDLKAQKARHSKSLLFEPRDAATQSFDTIWQICFEGYEELCMLDARFARFARNLFSEQSKDEDRTQMTAKENEELDKIIESFLGLVCGRLLLKPAMKAVEWLVRRFRAQEYNTECMLLTFLPYHTSHIFPTLLSIIPEQLPPTFRFLHPYVASLQSPPRHSILSAAISNQGFFSALSHYVLSASRARHHSAVLLGFWASITAQAVNGMIDASRSGRDAVRKQREEDILFRLLPILQSAFRIKGVPELYLGACMIMTVLATKASLEDKVLNAMMEAVVGGWTDQTQEDGLRCMAVIAEEKQETRQPQIITRALLELEQIFDRLLRLGESQRVSNLVLGTALGLVDQTLKTADESHFRLLDSLLKSDAQPDEHSTTLLTELLVALSQARKVDSASASSRQLLELLSSVSEDARNARLLSLASSNAQIELPNLQIQPAYPVAPNELVVNAEDVDMEDTGLETAKSNVSLEDLRSSLPNLPAQQMSFLSHGTEGTFQAYANAFQASLASASTREAFLNLSQLRKSDSIRRPEFLSFLARVWTSGTTPLARIAALDLATRQINDVVVDGEADLQDLVPYLISALADSSQKVRGAASKFCTALARATASTSGKKPTQHTAFDIYGTPSDNKLPSEDVQKFLETAIAPVLEDCVVSNEFILQALADSLNHGAPGHAVQVKNASAKELKKSLRSAGCDFVAAHVTATPVLTVQRQLLSILHRAGKSAHHARVNVLLPYVRQWLTASTEHATEICAAQKVSLHEMDEAVLSALTHRSPEELQILKEVVSGQMEVAARVLPVAFHRLKQIWSSLKNSQIAVVDLLLNIALSEANDETSQARRDFASETLRNIELPTDVLVHILDSLPGTHDLSDQPPSAKKRRTSKSDAARPRNVDAFKLQSALGCITLVLELVEGAKPEKHPQLLKGLFHLLSELHHYKTLAGSELVYLQVLLLGALRSVVDGLKSSSVAEIDRSIIRTDLIVECVRTTSSTQVHNTALLLVAGLASWAPDLVLHSVMPLFTFMSGTMLRASDDYTAHVTDQTVARIVPPLTASLKKSGKNLASGVSDLLLSFVTAFEHIPLHRRLGLFEHLVQTAGPEETLFAVLAMLIERYPDDSRTPQFVTSLTNHFPAVTALVAAKQYLGLVSDALKPKRAISETLLGLSDKSNDVAQNSINNLIHGLAALLRDRQLRKRLASQLVGGNEEEKIRATYATILEHAMKLNRDLAANGALKASSDALLHAVLGLMPTKDFIDSSSQLMQTGSDQTRQQVFKSLEARVASAKSSDTESRQVFIDVLPNCGVFLQEDQPVATRHAAISCMDQISEKYGKTDRAAVFAAAEQVAGPAALGSSDESLRIISTLCLASMVEVLGDDCVPILPKILTLVLGEIHGALYADEPEPGYVEASFSFFNAVLDHLPWMLSAKHLDDALKQAVETAGPFWEIFDELVAHHSFCDLVSKRIGAAELLASLQRIWKNLSAAMNRDVYRQYLEILHGSIKFHTKSTITRNAQTLFAVLLQAFDMPCDESEVLDPIVDAIVLDMTLKLNDATFRPFYIRLVEWAPQPSKVEVSTHERRLERLYSFSHLLFDRLKSIVTSYGGYLIPLTSELLEMPFIESRTLLPLVLKTLSTSFNNDQDDFWHNPAHFDPIALPLTAQLQKPTTAPISLVISTITSLAAAVAASPDHLKTLNAALMALMRHQDAHVRLAAVQCERSVTEQVRFDWLALLPEMLPVISEVQEDEDEQVEREVLRWVAEIEGVTGESLGGMLA